MDQQEMLDRLVPLFATGGRFHDRYHLDPAFGPVELIPGALWELPVSCTGSIAQELLRVYAFDGSAGQLLQAHWRNETRALLRLSTRGHPSLPRLLEAELLSQRDIGYLIVADSGRRLTNDDSFLGQLRADPRRAFLSFFSLVEAVAAMHEEGLLHRDLSLHALRIDEESDTIVVDGFQMSSFVAAWFRPGAQVASPTMAPSSTSRWMLAPERLSALRGEPTRDIETYATDVFGLGMIGTHLFVGELTPPPTDYAASVHRDWIETQRTALRRLRLPLALERSIDAMTAVDRRNRIPSAVVAHEVLSKAYGSILWDLERRPPPTARSSTRGVLQSS